jgi:transposase-like protein
MEDSHIPLNKWLLAFYMMCASKTQVSALQLQRQLGLGSYRSAWHLCHRIRHALKEGNPGGPFTGTVEADESWVGGRRTGRGHGFTGNKTQIVSLVERGGRVRTHVVERITGAKITKLLRENLDPSVRLNTDESKLYDRVGKEFRSHDRVNHSRYEYGRFDRKTRRLATTNAVEGFFGNAKRSIDGTHHSISRRHAGLYFAEVDYKYNSREATDGERTVGAIRRSEGKRLTLHDPVRK